MPPAPRCAGTAAAKLERRVCSSDAMETVADGQLYACGNLPLADVVGALQSSGGGERDASVTDAAAAAVVVRSLIYLVPRAEDGYAGGARRAEAAASGIHYEEVPFDSSALDDALRDACVDALARAPKPAVVECASGKRAGAACMVYLGSGGGGSGDGSAGRAELARALERGLSYTSKPELRAWVERHVRLPQRAREARQA